MNVWNNVFTKFYVYLPCEGSLSSQIMRLPYVHIPGCMQMILQTRYEIPTNEHYYYTACTASVIDD